MYQGLHAVFGATSTREYPARDGRPARIATEQTGYLTFPAHGDEPELRTPFRVSHRDGEPPYRPGVPYVLTYQHFTVDGYGRPQFNPFARWMEALPAVGTTAKAS